MNGERVGKREVGSSIRSIYQTAGVDLSPQIIDSFFFFFCLFEN